MTAASSRPPQDADRRLHELRGGRTLHQRQLVAAVARRTGLARHRAAGSRRGRPPGTRGVLEHVARRRRRRDARAPARARRGPSPQRLGVVRPPRRRAGRARLCLARTTRGSLPGHRRRLPGDATPGRRRTARGREARRARAHPDAPPQQPRRSRGSGTRPLPTPARRRDRTARVARQHAARQDRGDGRPHQPGRLKQPRPAVDAQELRTQPGGSRPGHRRPHAGHVRAGPRGRRTAERAASWLAPAL